MDTDSQSLTPPGSPVAGLKLRTGIRTLAANKKNVTRGSAPIYSFCCKGPIRAEDKAFSTDGYFLRNEVFSVLKILHPLNNAFSSSGDKSSSYTFFGYKFDPTDKSQFKIMIQMCRKRIYALENLARTSFSFGLSILSRSRSTLDSSNEDDHYGNPYRLRRDICAFLNFLVIRSKKFSETELQNLFSGLMKSLGTTKQWSSSMQHHCGSKDGDDCSSPEYHLFHVYLELRWSFLIIFGMNQSVVNWIFEDLLLLAHVKFKSSEQNLVDRTPFNCYCVKEVWAMIRIVLDRVKPNGRDFWDILTSSLTRVDPESDVFFPLWIMSNFVELSDYEMNGAYKKLEKKCSPESNCYTFINQLLCNWTQSGGRQIEVNELVHRFLPYWGFDLNVTQTLWSHWVARIDKKFEVRNVDHYSTPTKWFRLISWICNGKADPPYDTESDPLISDPFLSFLKLLSDNVKHSALKDWRKLKSSICNRLTSKSVEGFSENGLTRLTTLLLCLVYVTTGDAQDMGERLNEILDYGKESLQIAKFRGRCTMVLILLEKQSNVASISTKLMKSVDEVMGTIGRNTAQRDLGMVYLDLLDNLPKYSPDLDIGQSFLISHNLTAWLTSCGSNCVGRTLRTVHNLFDNWLLNSESLPSKEKTLVSNILQERTEQFLTQTVLLNQNRNPECDIEPYAELAADFTILQKSKQNTDAVNKLFELFSLNPRTCPQVCEIYMDRIINSAYFSDSSFASSSSLLNDIQLTQSWLRLVTMGSSVPSKLSARILNSTFEEVLRFKNEILLKKFLALVESVDSPWNRTDITTILNPLSNTVKAAAEKVYDTDEKLISSVIRSSMYILKHIKLDKIYMKNCQSGLFYQTLEGFVPTFLGRPPWEKLSTSLIAPIGECLPLLFRVIVANENWMNDPFLKRKLCDIYRFAFFGYIKSEDLEDSNPIVVITQQSENLPSFPVILNEMMLSLQILTKEEKLTKRFLLSTVGVLKRKWAHTSAFLLGFVTEMFIEKDGEFTSKCTSIIANTWALILSREAFSTHIPVIIRGLQAAMTKHFSFRSKRFFDLFISLSKFSSRKPVMRTFMKDEIMPLINTQIRVSENKQGSGVNYAMRTQLKQLEVSLQSPPGF